MGLINRAIPSLFNGVSQQPAQLRLPSQCEASVNFYPTVAVGLRKRPPTQYKAKLSSAATASALVHTISRDTSERYTLVLLDGDLEVFDAFTGTAKTVSFPAGKTYLDCVNPREDFSVVTVADHTFIVNKTVTVAMDTPTAPGNTNTGFVVFSYFGAGVQRAMEISVDGVVKATYSGAAADISSVVNSMRSSLTTNLGAGWTVTKQAYNILKITKSGATAWTLTASDDYGNATMKVIKDSVALFSDLPPNLPDGYIAYVSPQPGKAGKGYYVRYSEDDKSYIECPAPGALTDLKASTMPHKLVRNSDGTFTFEPFTWDSRTVGDDTSNPQPSFVGSVVHDIFLYRNRLGMLSGENVVLSEAGNYFNFFALSAAAVTDSDPIDTTVANNKVSILNHALALNKTLMLFSDQTQFQLSGGDLLTPRSVKADPVTEFTSSANCRPVGAGSELFFVTDRGTHSGVREYFITDDTLVNDAADITAHVPAYLPSGIFRLAVSTSEDVLFVLSSQKPNSLYVYKYMWGKDEKVQSAWFEFRLDAGDTVLGCDFVGTTAHLVIARSDGLYLETMEFQHAQHDTGLPFTAALDRKVSLTGVYDPAENKTRWTLPWPLTGTVQAVLGSSFTSRAGDVLTLTQGATAYIAEALGDWSAGAALVGVQYEARFRFSEQYVKDQNDNAISSAKLRLRRMRLSYVDTSHFRVEVTPPQRDTLNYIFTNRKLGTIGTLLGSLTPGSGSYPFPILSSARGVLIELVNDSPLPSTFQGAEWEGELVVQAAR